MSLLRRFPFEFIRVESGFVAGNHQHERGKSRMPAECLQNVREVPIENEALKKHRNDAEHRDDDNKQLVEENVCRTAVMVTVDDEVIDKQGGEKHHRRDAHINIPTSPKVVVAGESLGIKDDIGDDVVDLVVEIPHENSAEHALLHVLVVPAVGDEERYDAQEEHEIDDKERVKPAQKLCRKVDRVERERRRDRRDEKSLPGKNGRKRVNDFFHDELLLCFFYCNISVRILQSL